VFDFIERINLFACNKKVIDSLALSGAFDSFNMPREPFLTPNDKGETFSEIIIRYGNRFQNDKKTAGASLFGDTEIIEIAKPALHKCQEWNDLERLNKEKELIGIYLSAHPLDEYRIILNYVCNTGVIEISSKEELKGKEICLGGIVTGSREGTTKNGKSYMIITMEDFTGTGEIPLFGNDYIDYNKYGKPGTYLFIKASVLPRQYRETELDFKIKSIQLLQDVKDTVIEKMTVSLSIHQLDEQIINEMSVLIKNNPGKTQLFFKIIDGEHQTTLNLFSKSIRTEVTENFVDFLSENENIDFTINK
jgi:DNA polymerase-3 subunit alpha